MEFIFFCFQSAELLLFVIDNRTRAVSSMIETAYLTGKDSLCSSANTCIYIALFSLYVMFQTHYFKFITTTTVKTTKWPKKVKYLRT